MDKKAVLTIGGVVILLLAIVIGTIVYLSSLFRNNSNSRVVTSNPGSVTIPTSSSLPSTGGSTLGTSLKTYQGQGFTMQYPANWGILTCTNSQNFEFNPDGGDQKITCNIAQKPITVIVGANCSVSGTAVTLGRNTVYKTKKTYSDGDTWYEWCVKGATNSLDITDRVSNHNSPASDPDDYSAQVEQIISQTYFGGAS